MALNSPPFGLASVGAQTIATFGALPNTRSCNDWDENIFAVVDPTDTSDTCPMTEAFNVNVAAFGVCRAGTNGGAGVRGGVLTAETAGPYFGTGDYPATSTPAAFRGALMFEVDDVPVSCDPLQESGAPCFLRVNRQYPFLPTGAIADPLRTHYSHVRAGLRYDVINTDEDYDPKAKAGHTVQRFGAVRGLLSLTNTGHEDHHVKVAIKSSFFYGIDSDTVLSSSGDDEFDNGDSAFVGKASESQADDVAPIIYTQFRSTCTKRSHHWNIISSSATFDGSTCEVADDSYYGDRDGINGATVTAKVLVPAGETVIVAGIHEVFQPHRTELAQKRLKDIEKRSHHHDLHWFADLTDKERKSIVNFCVKDDKAETSSDSSTGHSISTSRISSTDFSFGFLDSADAPWQDRSHRRHTSEFSSDLSSSKVYSSDVGHVERSGSGVSTGSSSSSSSSSSTTRSTGWGDAWFAKVKAERQAEMDAAAV